MCCISVNASVPCRYLIAYGCLQALHCRQEFQLTFSQEARPSWKKSVKFNMSRLKSTLLLFFVNYLVMHRFPSKQCLVLLVNIRLPIQNISPHLFADHVWWIESRERRKVCPCNKAINAFFFFLANDKPLQPFSLSLCLSLASYLTKEFL